MISEEFKEYLVDYFLSIYETIPCDKEVSMTDILEAHDKLLEEWSYYFNDTDVWYEGYKLLCESIGDCYFTLDTDGPEENFICFELIKLVLASNDKLILKMDKEFKSWLKKEEISKDFDEYKETKFVPSFQERTN